MYKHIRIIFKADQGAIVSSNNPNTSWEEKTYEPIIDSTTNQNTVLLKIIHDIGLEAENDNQTYQVVIFFPTGTSKTIWVTPNGNIIQNEKELNEHSSRVEEDSKQSVKKINNKNNYKKTKPLIVFLIILLSCILLGIVYVTSSVTYTTKNKTTIETSSVGVFSTNSVLKELTDKVRKSMLEEKKKKEQRETEEKKEVSQPVPENKPSAVQPPQPPKPQPSPSPAPVQQNVSASTTARSSGSNVVLYTVTNNIHSMTANICGRLIPMQRNGNVFTATAINIPKGSCYWTVSGSGISNQGTVIVQ